MSSHAHVGIKKRRADRKKRKDRLCVIALAVERRQDGETPVTVWPVTRRPPNDAAAGVEIPRAVKTASAHGSLSARATNSSGPVMICEKCAAPIDTTTAIFRRALFKDVLAAFWAWHKAHKVTVTPR
jgi:hypothetical protein